MSHSECSFLETGRFVAHPWHCDANGHLNTRFIQGFFDDATQHLLASCGYLGASGAGNVSIADVKCTMEYVSEIAPGTLLLIKSGFKALGGKSFTTLHEMRSARGETLSATCETVSVFFDLTARNSAPMPERFRANAARRLVVPMLATKQSEGAK